MDKGGRGPWLLLNAWATTQTVGDALRLKKISVQHRERARTDEELLGPLACHRRLRGQRTCAAFLWVQLWLWLFSDGSTECFLYGRDGSRPSFTINVWHPAGTSRSGFDPLARPKDIAPA